MRTRDYYQIEIHGNHLLPILERAVAVFDKIDSENVDLFVGDFKERLNTLIYKMRRVRRFGGVREPSEKDISELLNLLSKNSEFLTFDICTKDGNQNVSVTLPRDVQVLSKLSDHVFHLQIRGKIHEVFEAEFGIYLIRGAELKRAARDMLKNLSPSVYHIEGRFFEFIKESVAP